MRIIKQLLIWTSAFMLLTTPVYATAQTGESNHNVPARKETDSGKVKGIDPLKQGVISAAETAPITYMFRITNSLRLFLRIPARNSSPVFSFENVTLLYSVHKMPVSRILLDKYLISRRLCCFPPCRYYVFALREIVI